jgi:hypothetical protein
MSEKKFTNDSFRKLCNNLGQELSQWCWYAPANDEGVRSTVIVELFKKAWEEAGRPDDSTFKVDWRTPDDKSLNDRRRQEIINIVQNCSDVLILPGPIIDETVQYVIDSWHRRGKPHQS